MNAARIDDRSTAEVVPVPFPMVICSAGGEIPNVTARQGRRLNMHIRVSHDAAH
jgi:hypothetical protein